MGLILSDATVMELAKLGQAICSLTELVIRNTDPEVKKLNAEILKNALEPVVLMQEFFNKKLGEALK